MEKEITIKIPFTYTLGEMGEKTGKVLETIEDCKAEVLAEIEDGLTNIGCLEVETREV